MPAEPAQPAADPARFEALRFEVDGGVARLTLARPEAAGAIDLRLARELLHAAIRCDEDPAVRAVLLTGSGRFFCAGGDVSSFREAGEGMAALIKEMTIYLHAAISRLARMRAPLVTAVNGTAAGGGFGLACAGDLVLAAESARFVLAYTQIGLSPDASSSWTLPRLVGRRRALELMLTNRSLTAAEALDWGIVTRVLPDAELAGEAEGLARRLAEGPTEAYGHCKRLVLLSAGESLETQMEHETRAIAAAARTRDGREGVEAFLGKRPPRFEGR